LTGSRILDAEMEREGRLAFYGNPRPRWERSDSVETPMKSETKVRVISLDHD